MITTKDKKKSYDKIYSEINKAKRLEKTKEWKKSNPDKVKAYYKNNKIHVNKKTKEWYESNIDKVKDLNLKRRFGITLEEYDKLLVKQNNSCAICKRNQTEFKIKLAVDHNHKTGEIRGLLCNNCNNGLGRFKDNKVLLSEAIKYLEQCSQQI
jgi:hypothetical protein